MIFQLPHCFLLKGFEYYNNHWMTYRIQYEHRHRWNADYSEQTRHKYNGLDSTLTAKFDNRHYNDVIMNATASLITSLTIVYSTVYSSADQRKHQSSASLACVRGIHRRPVNSPHKWPVTRRKMFPFDDVIMASTTLESRFRHRTT